MNSGLAFHRGRVPQRGPGVRGLRSEGATSPPSPLHCPHAGGGFPQSPLSGQNRGQNSPRAGRRGWSQRPTHPGTPLPCGPRRCGHRTRGPRPSCWRVRPWQRNLDSLCPPTLHFTGQVGGSRTAGPAAKPWLPQCVLRPAPSSIQWVLILGVPSGALATPGGVRGRWLCPTPAGPHRPGAGSASRGAIQAAGPFCCS